MCNTQLKEWRILRLMETAPEVMKSLSVNSDDFVNRLDDGDPEFVEKLQEFSLAA